MFQCFNAFFYLIYAKKEKFLIKVISTKQKTTETKEFLWRKHETRFSMPFQGFFFTLKWQKYSNQFWEILIKISIEYLLFDNSEHKLLIIATVAFLNTHVLAA